MKQGKENFEFMKESDNEQKRNYLLQNDKITTRGITSIVIVLAILILAVIFIPKLIQ